MPKVNVYFPETLASTVRTLGLPVSEICQRGLEAELAETVSLRRLTPRSAKTLQAAARIADERHHAHVGTEHILLALLDDSAGIAGEVLADGDPQAIRGRLEAIMGSAAYAAASNRVVDRDGNLIGYAEVDDEGRITVMNEHGDPVDL